MKLEFIYTTIYQRLMKKYNFTNTDEINIEMTILKNPEIGVVVKGTSGVRKSRYALIKSNKGKSGGFPIFYLYIPESELIIFLALLNKKESENLSDSELNLLNQKVTQLKKFY